MPARRRSPGSTRQRAGPIGWAGCGIEHVPASRAHQVGSFARGIASIGGLGDDRGRTLAIDVQNGVLIARTGDDLLVRTPDPITVLDAETDEPITAGSPRYGFRVAVLGIPSAAAWRTERGLELVGPEHVGYDVPFVPVEERYRR